MGMSCKAVAPIFSMMNVVLTTTWYKDINQNKDNKSQVIK